MYKTPFGLLCKSTRHMLGLADVHCFFREFVAPLNYKYPFPPLLLHAYSKLWYTPRLPELRVLYNLERVVSLKEFHVEEPMSLLSFEVTLAYPTYLALFHFLIFVLASFSKSLFIISLEVLIFSK
jgi:hypothetical protein